MYKLYGSYTYGFSFQNQSIASTTIQATWSVFVFSYKGFLYLHHHLPALTYRIFFELDIGTSFLFTYLWLYVYTYIHTCTYTCSLSYWIFVGAYVCTIYIACISFKGNKKNPLDTHLQACVWEDDVNDDDDVDVDDSGDVITNNNDHFSHTHSHSRLHPTSSQ